MQTLEEFKSSLPADLTPDQRAEKLEEYALSIQDQYKNLQSKNDKDRNFTEDLLEETKKVGQDPNYVLELYKTRPDMAEMIIKKFGNGITIDDIKAGKGLNMGSQDDLIDKKIKEHEKQKELAQNQEKFVKTINLNDEEKKVFEEQLSKLIGGREITSQELQNLMLAVAFNLGKNISSKENIMLEKIIPVKGGTGGGGDGGYQPKSQGTVDWLKTMGVIKEAPKK